MTDLYNQIASIRPAKESDLVELTRLANLQEHPVLLPTSVVWKNNQIVGYLSIGAVPTVLMWLDKEQMKPRDSVQVFGFIEDVLRHHNSNTFIMPCSSQSPLMPIAEHAGFINTGLHNILVKQLT